MSNLIVNDPAKIQSLLQPSSIAVVGATENPGPGASVMKNALRSPALGGKVYPINPARKEVFGVPCHGSLRDLPITVDAVIIATAARAVVPVLREAAALGIRAATVLSSGFAEAPYEEGKKIQQEVLRIAREADMAVCGPNCLGVADLGYGSFATTMSMPTYAVGAHDRSVAIVSQSGGLLISFVYRAAARRLPLRCFVSSGNEAVTRLEDYIDYFIADPAVRVIAGICESFSDGKRLLDLAKRAHRMGKRMALLKLGRSEQGQRAVQAHTGRLAGNDRLVSAALEEAGIAQFDRVDEVVEFCQLACHYPRFSGMRIAALMISGGIAALVSDIAERYGLQLARFTSDTAEELRTLLPAYGTVSNPLDMTGGTMQHNLEAIRRAIFLIAEDPGTDVLTFVVPLERDGGSEGMRNLIEYVVGLCDELSKPLVMISPTSSSMIDYWAEVSTTVAAPFLEDVETAFKAMKHWGCTLPVQISGTEEEEGRKPQPLVSFPPGRTILSEVDCYRLLETWKIPVAAYQLCTTVEQAVIAAEQIGYPVALKVASHDFPHKTDQGLVALRVHDGRALRKKFQKITTKALAAKRDAEIQGVLVQAWIDQGLEFLVGCQVDPQFGECILVASGGIFAEVFQDSVLFLAPVSAGRIREKLAQLKSYELLKGIREGHPYDIEAFCRLVEQVSSLVVTIDGVLKTFELNPVKVLHRGEGVFVVDALGIFRT